MLDFGLVKEVKDDDEENLTQVGFFMGSPKYVAPEQIENAPVDARTDIYSLGVVMYEMLTGRVPFERGATVKTLIAHIRDEPPPLWTVNPKCKVTPLLEQTVMRCLAKDPDQRVPSMSALLEVLKQSPAGTLTATLMNGSGHPCVDSGPLGLSSSLPQPTTVTAPLDTTSGGSPLENADEATHARASWRRYGPTLVAGAAGLGAVLATVLMVGHRTETPTKAELRAGTRVVASTSSIPQSDALAPQSASPSTSAKPPAPPLRLIVVPANVTVRTANGTALCDASPCLIPASRFEQGTLVVSIQAPGYRTHQAELVLREERVKIRLHAARVAPRQTTSPPVTDFGEFPPY